MRTRNRIIPLLLNSAALLTLGFVLTASDCHNDFGFTAPVNAEICNNFIDDDNNGLTDCRDPACATFPACVPALTINPISQPVTHDTLTVTGTVQHAVSISASISPVGSAGSVQISGSNWSVILSNLATNSTTLQVVGTDSTGALHDTVPVTFTVNLN